MKRETEKEIARHLRGVEVAIRRVWQAIEKDAAESKDEEPQDLKYQAKRA